MWWPWKKKPLAIKNVQYIPPPIPVDIKTRLPIEENIPPPTDWMDKTERTLRRIDRICQEMQRLKRDAPDSPRIESFRKELDSLTRAARKDRVIVNVKV